VGLLAELDQRPVGEHPEVFQRVHARLAEVLGDLDEDAG
jgi:sirohydrochlorin ferrochelatase